MKFWKEIIAKDKSYESALKYIEKYPSTSYITRPEWKGVHFISKDKAYCILLESGEVLIDELEVFDTDKNDWIIVTITSAAVKLLEDKELI